ncbi:RimK/LysX family protein [Pelagibius sp.]|uniref:ATP-dependent zinc protease family protein n=1 Tax=Pelagibius sp. TaxID=1931238 RepID=UPI0026325549|nr:RimK/LysX family protein [Pelagibius sp.]
MAKKLKAAKPAAKIRKRRGIKAEVTALLDKQAIVGWREWLSLPALGIERIKAKIDTGARTSALHAMRITPFDNAGELWVEFQVAPHSGGARDRARVLCRAPVRDHRPVKSSSGHTQDRYVITTPAVLAGRQFDIEVTLTNRAEMGFEMLFGRTSLRAGRFLVHPTRSFLLGR